VRQIDKFDYSDDYRMLVLAVKDARWFVLVFGVT